MDVQVSTEVDRPVGDGWRLYATEHVRIHPRWDPDMHLEQLSDGPIGLGTRIRRANTRWDAGGRRDGGRGVRPPEGNVVVTVGEGRSETYEPGMAV